MASIFLSYSRKSQMIAKTLVADIEALGYTLWFDQELSGGQVWWNQILEKIRNCNVFVFVLDPESINSTACKSEFGYASDLGKPVLPVLVSDGVSTNLLPPAISQIQFVDYRTQDRSSALCLARALSTIPPLRHLPDPLPAPPEVPVSYLGSLSAQLDATNLSYEQQSALLFDLNRSMRDPGGTHDVYVLLKKLRKRRDIFAAIAEEVDELLASSGKATTREAEFQFTRKVQDPAKTTLREPIGGESIDAKKTQPFTRTSLSLWEIYYFVLSALLGAFLGYLILGVTFQSNEGAGAGLIIGAIFSMIVRKIQKDFYKQKRKLRDKLNNLH